MDTKATIRKWHEKIGFPHCYDAEFYAALDAYEIDPSITIESYDLNEEDGKKNFLYFLWFCEAMHEKYRQKGIRDEIFYDNLTDMPRWLDTWSELKGGLYFGELEWFYLCFTLQPRPQLPALAQIAPRLHAIRFKGGWIQSDSMTDQYLSDRLRLQCWTMRFADN